MMLQKRRRRAIPPAFTSLEEAHNSWQHHSNQCNQLYDEISQTLKPERLSESRIYLEIFHQWQLALQAFLKNAGDSLSSTAQQAARVLQLNAQMLTMQIDASTQDDRRSLVMGEDNAPQFPPLSQLVWDKHIAKAQQMTALAREVVEYTVKEEARPNSHRFALDNNIVPILSGIASICRDPVVRREAVALLYGLPHQQGLWDSVMTVRVTEKLVSIEEEGLEEVRRCEDVPEWARVRGVNISFDSEGRLDKINYQRNRRPGEPGSEDHEESFQW